MSHKPPIPDASVSPFPAHPAPITTAVNTEDKVAISDDASGSGLSGKTIGIAAGAAAVGSAAVAAALLFYNRAGDTSPNTGSARETEKSKVSNAANK
jgi:hypothetical protein